MHDGAVQYIYGMEDQQKLWDDAIERINDRVIARGIEIGIKEYKKFDFEEFYIQDMYKTAKGMVCFKCRRGVYCEIHKLERKEDPLL